MTFLDKAFLVLPMTMVIILGNIDISVASTVALSAVSMAVSYNAGLPMVPAMLLCLAVATLCGLANGLLMARFKELSSVIVTLSTMTIYRGIAYVILEDQASGKFPEWYSQLGWGMVGKVPIILIVFAVCAVLFWLLLHKTAFGRKVYGMGNNLTASRYSGVKTDSILIIVSVLTGLMGGFLAQKLAPWDAARLGVYLHGLAADYWAAQHGPRSLIAGDLLRVFPEVLSEFIQGHIPQTEEGVCYKLVIS